MKRSSVSLDQETYAISKRIGNFSAFVRECLRRWNAYDLQEHIQPERADLDLGKKCFPRHSKGCCVLCWPDGPPEPDDWKYYCESGGKVVVGKRADDNPIFEMREYNNEWIMEKARLTNIVPHFEIPQEKTFNYDRKSRSKGGGKRSFSPINEGYIPATPIISISEAIEPPPRIRTQRSIIFQIG